MDGRGRCTDSAFVERLWRGVKYEEVYLKAYDAVKDVREGIGAYFRFYSDERSYQALAYRTASKVFPQQVDAEDAVLQYAEKGVVKGAGSGTIYSVRSRHEGN